MAETYGKPVAEHMPCWTCTSSDAAAIYQDTLNPERYYGICYSNKCTKEFTEQEAMDYIEEVKGSLAGPKGTPSSNIVDELPKWVPVPPSTVLRGLTKRTLDQYKVDTIVKDGEIIAHNYRYYGPVEDDDANIVYKPTAIKHRYANKKFQWTKLSQVASRDCGFFGQGASFSPSKSVLITEGEIDAMSAWQMLVKSMPCISLKNGAGDSRLNDYQKSYLDKFEVIYLCFDNDQTGQEGAKRFSQHFKPEKVRIVHLPDGVKDPNDLLLQSRSDDFNAAVRMAKSVAREGFIFGRDTLPFLTEAPSFTIPYPWKKLNDMVYGIDEGGELITILSGSGLGKSTVMKQLGLHLFKWKPEATNTHPDVSHLEDLKIGTLFLEENTKRKTIKIFTGMEMGKNLILPDVYEEVISNDEYTEDMKRIWAKLFDNDRWVLWDHWGSNSVDAILETIRYMVSNFGIKIILFDHISIVLSGGVDGGDERKQIDRLMTGLRQLVEELGFICVAISHVTKGGDGTPHEEGGRVKLSHARGAGTIYQLSDTVLGLERNGQDENPALRNITSVRVLKSRLSGETGPACKLAWSKKESKLQEVSDEQYEQLLQISDPDEQAAFLDGDFFEVEKTKGDST